MLRTPEVSRCSHKFSITETQYAKYPQSRDNKQAQLSEYPSADIGFCLLWPHVAMATTVTYYIAPLSYRGKESCRRLRSNVFQKVYTNGID